MPPPALRTALTGELTGTFLMVFFGCGSIAASILTGAQSGIFQVAIVWGLGIAAAIHLTASLSGAHLNPAVTVAMAAWNGFPKSRILPYAAAQLAGSVLASAVLYLLYRDALAAYETAHHLIRGNPGSEATAMLFGEYFPSPGGKPLTPAARTVISPSGAFFAELCGTAVLLFVICGISDERNPSRPGPLTAAFTGLTVTLLISLLGPLTMAGFNPARDLGPRLFSACAGWGSLPFTVNGSGWLTVYILAPLAGGWLGTGLYHKIIRPLHQPAKSPRPPLDESPRPCHKPDHEHDNASHGGP